MEKYLVQNRDIEEVMKSANTGGYVLWLVCSLLY